MEIETPQAQKLHRQALGIQLAGIDSEQLFGLLMQTDVASDLKKQLTIVTQQHENFDQNCTQYYKQNADKKKYIKDVNGTFNIDTIEHTKLSPTTKSFSLCFDPKRKVFSDEEAQINQVAAANQNPADIKYEQQELIVTSDGRQQITSKITIGTLPITQDTPIAVDTQITVADLFCKCQRKYIEGEIMIQCMNQKCEISWFHPKCVGIYEEDMARLNQIEFYCDDCRDREGSKPYR